MGERWVAHSVNSTMGHNESEHAWLTEAELQTGIGLLSSWTLLPGSN